MFHFDNLDNFSNVSLIYYIPESVRLEEINYKNIFKHIYNKGYKGILGMEHGNSIKEREGEILTIESYRKVDNFLS